MRGRLSCRLHARRARQQTVSQSGDRHDANCNSSDHWQCERFCLAAFGPLTHIFPRITMPERSIQQDLRNFEATSFRLEPLAMVNAKLLFGYTCARCSSTPRSRPARHPQSDRRGARYRSTAGSWSRGCLFSGGCRPERLNASCWRAGWQATRCRPGSPPA